MIITYKYANRYLEQEFSLLSSMQIEYKKKKPHSCKFLRFTKKANKLISMEQKTEKIVWVLLHDANINKDKSFSLYKEKHKITITIRVLARK